MPKRKQNLYPARSQHLSDVYVSVAVELCPNIFFLYYREVITSIDSLEVGTRIEYRPIDEECWTKGTVMINERNGKYVQCDDGIVDYPRKRDVIRMI